MKKPITYILEFYDSTENNTIFSMVLPRLDSSLLMLHQPNDNIFFIIHKNPIKFTVDDQKHREVIYLIVEGELIEIKVRVPLCHLGNGDYQNIPEWWKDIKLVS